MGENLIPQLTLIIILQRISWKGNGTLYSYNHFLVNRGINWPLLFYIVINSVTIQ